MGFAFAQLTIQRAHHLHVRRHFVPRFLVGKYGTYSHYSRLLFVGEESEVVTIVINKLAHLLIVGELVVVERVDVLATVEESASLVACVDDGLEELQMIALCEPTFHQSDSFVDGMDKWASVKFMRETTIIFQECIKLTVVCLLAVAEQLGAIVATLHRHYVENMLPSINEVIKHLLRNGFCFLHSELASITHNVACRILTAHVGIVVIVECIQMAAYQFIKKIDGGIV